MGQHENKSDAIADAFTDADGVSVWVHNDIEGLEEHIDGAECPCRPILMTYGQLKKMVQAMLDGGTTPSA